MSVGKTADYGNVPIFTKDGVTVYIKKKMCSSHVRESPFSSAIEMNMVDTKYHYLNITANGNHTDPQRKRKENYSRHIAYTTCHPKKKLSN